MASETTAKRLKVSPPAIGTHNGHFHADEALAVYLLRLLPSYQPSTLVRTRDPALLSTCHTVVDVGGEYDPSKHRYDHHQRTFNTTFPSHSTKLSSAGLVFLHFGKAIIAQKLSQPVESPAVAALWEKLYTDFVEALDAHDNGISAYDTAALNKAGVSKRFSDGGVSIGSLIGDLNPNWNDPTPASKDDAQAAEDEKFIEASEFIGKVFSRKLDYYAQAWLPARELVQEAYANRQQHDPEGRIMVFKQGVPWKDHLYSLEDEAGTLSKVLYVLYPESPSPDAKWRIQCVPVSKDSFESRKPLPEAWRGCRDADLDKVAGIEGGVFVHASGFIGGAKTFDAVKSMASKSFTL
ncbi:MAG: hypothetical protein M1824_001458 [Vezdaea acicularis]|nr:MAG: hypothetical protein M1824_001458 [Vezdaea acicularis]